jgi:hypothetical protein
MTSIIAVVQVAAGVTALVLAVICLVSTIKTPSEDFVSLTDSRSRRQIASRPTRPNDMECGRKAELRYRRDRTLVDRQRQQLLKLDA